MNNQQGSINNISNARNGNRDRGGRNNNGRDCEGRNSGVQCQFC